MFKKYVVLVSFVALSTLSFAQARKTSVAPSQRPFSAAQYMVQPLRAEAPVAPATVTCAHTYSSGTGETQVTYCVTVNGNITQLSRAGQEMINQGVVGEGYGICDFTTGTPYYDYAYEDSGNLLGSSLGFPNAKTAVSTRISSDGIWQFTNTITQVASKPTAAGSITVKTTVKNLSGINRNIFFLRYADVDADLDPSNNDFDWDINTASGIYSTGSSSFGYGLALVNNTFAPAFPYHAEYTQNTYQAPNPCSPFANISTQPFHGDGSVMSLFGQNTLGHGKSKIYTVTYQPL